MCLSGMPDKSKAPGFDQRLASLSVGGDSGTSLVRRCGMVALRKPPSHRMTVAEFLTWDADDRTVHAWQLIDGEPVAMAPASDNHGAIQANLTARLWNHLELPGNRCRVATEPGIVPRGHSDRNYRVPDIGVTRAPQSIGFTVPLAAIYRTTTLAMPGGNPP